MRIAICDHDPQTLYLIRQLLYAKPAFAALGRQSLVYYQEAKQLLQDYQQRIAYDLIWFAVEAEAAGLALAEEIRRLDRDVLFIVLAENDQAVIPAFHLGAFVYLQKPLKMQEVENELKRAVENYRLRHYCCQFFLDDQQLTISIEQIVFLESKGRSLDIYTADHHRINVPGKMQEAEEALTSWGFVRTHKSFLVNLAYIENIGQRDVVTSLRRYGQPVLVDVSERRRPKLRKLLHLYRTGGLMLTRDPLPFTEEEKGIFHIEACPL